MKLFAAIGIIGLVLSSSCHIKQKQVSHAGKTNALKRGKKSQALKRFSSEKCRGHIYISTAQGAYDSATYDPSFQYTYSVLGAIVDRKKHKLKFGNLVIGSEILSMTNDNEYSSNNVYISSGDTSNIKLYAVDGSLEFDVPLYFPKMIDASTFHVPNLLTVGSTMTWSADVSNNAGVIINLEYNLLNDMTNVAYRANSISKMIYIESDAGSYTFTADDLSGANQTGSNANSCIVDVIRGSYVMAYNSSNKRIKIKVYTVNAGPRGMVRTN